MTHRDGTTEPLRGDSQEPSPPGSSDTPGKTLVFEIALPEFFADDLDPDSEAMREFYGDDGMPLTPEQLMDAVMNESGLISGGHVRIILLTGDKGGDELQRMDGFIVGAKVVPRVADHEREKDDRLDYYEERWVEQEHRRLRND